MIRVGGIALVILLTMVLLWMLVLMGATGSVTFLTMITAFGCAAGLTVMGLLAFGGTGAKSPLRTKTVRQESTGYGKIGQALIYLSIAGMLYSLFAMSQYPWWLVWGVSIVVFIIGSLLVTVNKSSRTTGKITK